MVACNDRIGGGWMAGTAKRSAVLRRRDCARTNSGRARGGSNLFLPGALFVTVSAQFFAAFMFINFCLPAFFQ